MNEASEQLISHDDSNIEAIPSCGEKQKVPAYPRPLSLKSILFQPLKPLAQLLLARLFPGNAGVIDYKYLNDKVDKRVDGYEPMAGDVEHYRLTAPDCPWGLVVGVHVYPAIEERPKEVVIFCHGNIRPSRYMNGFLEQLSGNRKRVVVARDFPGYDLSPAVDHSLEAVACAMDKITYLWAKKQYPDATIIPVGRSIGTMGWANMLSLPRVDRAVGIVPFSNPVKLVTRQITPRSLAWIPWWTELGKSFARLVCDEALPRGYNKALQIPTFGFSASAAIDAADNLSNKTVLLFRASDDEWVSSDDAEILAKKLSQSGARGIIAELEGRHAALPGDAKNVVAGTHI